MERKGKKVCVGDVEYEIYKGVGFVKLVREEPVHRMRVENVFHSMPDSRSRMVAFKHQAARLVAEAIEKDNI
ncbi:hypothetical protein [Desulfovirgula thermocuniculi]|uniref:hypothetical protein n=1 Tax=Desulfovirgula thermocuniculi TaxID=348842 RepID=UPI00042A3474|nr:hypothetical protein [Desulfovirgula thermocuniculi]